jgi:hypothetical protein
LILRGVNAIKYNLSIDVNAQKPKILFVYADTRAGYLAKEFKGKINLIDTLQVRIDARAIGRNLE